jgi:hypothetical protein
MNNYIVRTVVALLLAGLLWAQARASQGQPHRRRTFELAAAALLAFAAFNGSLAAGATFGTLQLAIAVIGVALLFGAAVSFALSLRSGELRDRHDRVIAAAREYRERREQRDREGR